ncbi:hypothetical protein DFP77_12316 [Marinomonas foliarum]|uniref:Uncharacterized protein n=1 Tax=Marinomonas foliarum TaxID=491950 RepID=A0A368ZWZ8_9GAMM|nr:hypothetical protein DFP77_12316 [Marinomonas foliarum]
MFIFLRYLIFNRLFLSSISILILYSISELVTYKIKVYGEPSGTLKTIEKSIVFKGISLSYVLSDGFDIVETWGVWSNSSDSSLKTPYLKDDLYEIKIDGSVLQESQLSKAQAFFYVNNVFIGKTFFNFDDGFFKYKFQENIEGILVIKIQGAKGLSPKELNMNDDERVLYYGIREFEISRS